MRDRRAALTLREFLYAQEVQAPFEIYSDWLLVGHIDEIISFVPAPSGPGFRVLIASPRRTRGILDGVEDPGAILWQGQRRREGGKLVPAEETIKELLDREALWSFNDDCQAHLDGVREEMSTQLALGDGDFAEIPVLFKPVGTDPPRALAYFPDMVNHLVLGGFSIVPKPFGPSVEGEDVFERAFREAVPQQQVRFVDDWLPYHEAAGEVHCGTNVRRRPPQDVRWWEHRLPGSRDASVRRRA